jgi:hypothetical protein
LIVVAHLAGAIALDDSLSWNSRGRTRRLVVHGALLC